MCATGTEQGKVASPRQVTGGWLCPGSSKGPLPPGEPSQWGSPIRPQNSRPL